MSLTIYGHFVSQPTRAVLWCLAMKDVPHKFVKVNPVGGEAETPEFLAKFPMGAVPALEEASAGGQTLPFYLSESHAILTYLAQKHGWADWYPTDLHHRAKVDQWLHWQHGNLRGCTTHIFRPNMLRVMGISKKDADAKFVQRMMRDNLLVMTYEGQLKQRPFLTAGAGPTLADICAYCELDQLLYGNLYDFSPYPEVQAWMKRMQALPHHDNIRRSMFKLVEKFKEQPSTAAPGSAAPPSSSKM